MKIKKLFVLILSIITIIMCVCFAGCSAEDSTNNTFGERFGIVEELSDYTCIIYDKETKVEYLYCRNPHNTMLTVMLDETGKPLLYEGD